MKVSERVLAGMGWQRGGHQARAADGLQRGGADRLAGLRRAAVALSVERQNLADYFKETVAVVTNPAIDREREIEHFSCRAVFGARPSIDRPQDEPSTIETAFPIILGGHHDMAPLSDETYRGIAKEHKTYLLEDLWERFAAWAAARHSASRPRRSRELERLKYEAAKKVLDGAELLVLSDRTAFDGERPGSIHTSRCRRSTAPCASTASRAAARTCAAAPRWCCARVRSGTCTTSAWRSGWAPTACAPT